MRGNLQWKLDRFRLQHCSKINVYEFSFVKPVSRRDSLVVSAPAYHAAGRGSIPAQTRHIIIILGVKAWLSTLETVYLCLSEETLKAVGPLLRY